MKFFGAKQINKKPRVIAILTFVFLLFSCFSFCSVKSNTCNNLTANKAFAEVDGCELKVHFIDVGQGDSILVELPDNKIMLVDAGPNKSEAALRWYLLNFFASRPNKIIDYFIATHQHEDHIGGADVVFDNYEVLNFYRPYVFTQAEMDTYGYSTDEYNVCTTKTFETTISKMQNEGCNVFFHEKSENPLGLDGTEGYTVEFLSSKQKKYDAPNDYSPITMITYQNRKIMLTGDAQQLVENEVLADFSSEYLDCDILKLGHHGSKTSTSQNFLNAVNPEYVAICCGLNNEYGHPHFNVYSRVVAKIGEENIYRTDKMGDVIFGIDKDSIVDGKAEIKISLAKVENVEAKINSIGQVEYTQQCKEKIDIARYSYDYLTTSQKTYVGNYQTLVDAEEEYSSQKTYWDQVNDVIAKIDNIGNVEYTAECKAKIDSAETSYNSLSADQRTQITNYEKFEDAKQIYAELEYEAQNAEQQKNNPVSQTAIIVIIVMSSLLVLCVTTYVVCYFVGRKKKLKK